MCISLLKVSTTHYYLDVVEPFVVSYKTVYHFVVVDELPSFSGEILHFFFIKSFNHLENPSLLCLLYHFP
jgi:hypothetical protein